MKCARIEFIEDRRWRWVWLAAAVVAVGGLAVFAWQARQEHWRVHAAQTQLAAAQQRLVKLAAPVITPANARQASAVDAAKLLQYDLSKALTVLESVKERGVRLRGLTLELPSNVMRLEYELDSTTKAATMGELLNGGYEKAPWQLESLNVTVPSQQREPAQAASLARGVWSAKLSEL